MGNKIRPGFPLHLDYKSIEVILSALRHEYFNDDYERLKLDNKHMTRTNIKRAHNNIVVSTGVGVGL